MIGADPHCLLPGESGRGSMLSWRHPSRFGVAQEVCCGQGDVAGGRGWVVPAQPAGHLLSAQDPGQRGAGGVDGFGSQLAGAGHVKVGHPSIIRGRSVKHEGIHPKPIDHADVGGDDTAPRVHSPAAAADDST